MRYLIDTNVLIERGRTRPHPKVKRWFDSLLAHQVVLCPIVAAEFMTGVFRLPPDKRAEAIRFLRDAVSAFCWVPIDLQTAVAYAELRSKIKYKPKANDLWIGSIARVNGLIVATRNETDFKPQRVATVDPFR